MKHLIKIFFRFSACAVVILIVYFQQFNRGRRLEIISYIYKENIVSTTIYWLIISFLAALIWTFIVNCFLSKRK